MQPQTQKNPVKTNFKRLKKSNSSFILSDLLSHISDIS